MKEENMEIYEILKSALEAVEKAEIPDDLRLKAFESAIDLYAMSSGSRIVASDGNKLTSGADLNVDSVEVGSSGLSMLSQKLKIQKEAIEEIFYLEDDGELKLIVGTSKFDSSNAGATKEIALLVSGGRQLSGIEEWTSANSIREACEYFGKYDGPNFAKTIKSMEDYFSLMGNGQKREVKLKRPGIEALQSLVNRLAGTNGGK